MRSYLFLSVLCILSNTTQAQPESISLQFNDASFTRNVNLTYHHSFFHNSFALYAGYKYLINNNRLFLGRIVELDKGTPDEMYVFYQPLSEAVDERIGLKAGAEITLLKNNDNSAIYGFYDFQYCYVNLKAVNGGLDTFGRLIATTFPFNPGGAKLFEHYLGIGIRHSIVRNIFLKVSASGGIFHLKDDTRWEWNGKENIPNNWAFSRMFGVGVEYRFINTIANKR